MLYDLGNFSAVTGRQWFIKNVSEKIQWADHHLYCTQSSYNVYATAISGITKNECKQQRRGYIAKSLIGLN